MPRPLVFEPSTSGDWTSIPRALVPESLNPSPSTSGDWISIPLGGGEDYKFQVQPSMRPGQLIEIQHTEEPEHEIIKVEVGS